MSGKHIELFLVEGVPGGITTAEIAGWTGHVLSGPRADLADMLNRAEAQRNGAYLLLGADPEAIENLRCYIGRTENLSKRLPHHHLNKSFWDRVVLITAKDDAFNEGHWGYLEARLVELATRAARSSLENSNNPLGRRLSEAQESDMEAFLANLQIILPVLGISVLRAPAAPPVEPKPAADPSPVFTLKSPKHGVDAQAVVNGDEFTMLAGSKVVGHWQGQGRTPSTQRSYASYRAQHLKLVTDGSIRVDGSVGTLTRDIPFNSPSTAGAIALGRSCNGRVSWLWEGGSYASWENRGVQIDG